MSHGVKGLQLPLEEAFKLRTNVESNEKPSGKAAEGSAAELQNKSENVKSPENIREEYTELPLHTLAQESILTAIHTGTQCGQYFLFLIWLNLKLVTR